MRRIGRVPPVKRWTLVALVLSRVALAQDGVQFSQRVDRTEVGTEDPFHVTIVVSGAEDGAVPQVSFPNDFEVLGKSSSSEMSYRFGGGGPGSIERTIRYNFALRANRAGRLTLPPAVLTSRGKTYRTDAITLTVKVGHVGGAAQPQTRQSPFGNFPNPFQGFPFPNFPGDDDAPPADVGIPRSDSDLFVKAMLDKDAVYVGEQATLSLWIFSRVDLSSVDQVSMPKLDGFWSEDIDSPTQLAPESRLLNGVPYRAYLLKRRALFPVHPGKLTIGPTGADITTGFIFSGHRIHRESNELTVKVKPLPSGAPPGFSPNNVGQWHLAAELTQAQVELGQPVTLRVTLEGVGNLKQVTPPAPNAPPALKVYDPTTADKMVGGHGHVAGRRTLEYLVMAQQTGRFELPELAFPFFDPATGRYEVTRTAPLTLNVLPGAGAAAAAVPSTGPVAAVAKNVLSAGGLKPLRTTAQFAPLAEPLWRSRAFIPALTAPLGAWLLLVLGGFVRASLLREDAGAQKRKKARAARRRLGEAEKLRAKGLAPAFYGEVEKAMLGFLEAKLGTAVGGLTRDALAARLEAAGADAAQRLKISKVLDACDLGRFAPGAGDAVRAQVLDQAEEAMEAWEAK